jgi:hypothetical protein
MEYSRAPWAKGVSMNTSRDVFRKEGVGPAKALFDIRECRLLAHMGSLIVLSKAKEAVGAIALSACLAKKQESLSRCIE